MPIVTLITDFGKDTHQLAKVKMELLKTLPQAQVFDISHQVAPHAADEAVYLIGSCLDDFPKDTVHIIGVDIDLYKHNRLLAAQYRGQVIISADNGFLSMLAAGESMDVYAVPLTEKDILAPFPLKTVLVPAAVKIIEKGIKAIGADAGEILEKSLEQPLMEGDILRGKVVYVNNYFNVITNISRSVFDNERMGRYFEITINRFDRITEINEAYSQVPEGEGMCFFNDNGLLEIAVNRGKAAQLLGLERGKSITVDFYAERPKGRMKPGGLL